MSNKEVLRQMETRLTKNQKGIALRDNWNLWDKNEEIGLGELGTILKATEADGNID